MKNPEVILCIAMFIVMIPTFSSYMYLEGRDAYRHPIASAVSKVGTGIVLTIFVIAVTVFDMWC